MHKRERVKHEHITHFAHTAPYCKGIKRNVPVTVALSRFPASDRVAAGERGMRHRGLRATSVSCEKDGYDMDDGSNVAIGTPSESKPMT